MRKRRYDITGERNISVKSNWSKTAENLLAIFFDAVDNDSRWHCECFSRRLGNIVRHIWSNPEVLCSFFFNNLRWTNLTWLGEKLKRIFKLYFDGAAKCVERRNSFSCDEPYQATWINLSHSTPTWLIIFNDFPTSSWFSGTWYLNAQRWLSSTYFFFMSTNKWLWHFYISKSFTYWLWLLCLNLCHGESLPCNCGFKFLSHSSWQLLQT